MQKGYPTTCAYAEVKARHDKRKADKEAADTSRKEKHESKKQKLNALLALVGDTKPADRDEVCELTCPMLKGLLLRDDLINYHERHHKLTKKADLEDMVCVLYGY